MTVAAGEEGHSSGDAAQICLSEPGTRRSRVWFQESVPEPESAWGEDAIQLLKISFLPVFGNAVETAEIQHKVEGTGDAVELGYVAHG